MEVLSPIYKNIVSGTSVPYWRNSSFTSSKISNTTEIPWIKDYPIAIALNELKNLKFAPKDLMYLKSMGINIPFKSGAEAFDFIKKQNVRILFEQTAEPGVHAQYDYYKNLITINQRYKNNHDFATILAISEAILHETGHAKDKDAYSSIQEELNFLGLNAIAHRAYVEKYGNIFSESNAPIVSDGVSIYAKLFFELDPEKQALKKRIADKYGDLPAGNNVHPAGIIAKDIKTLYQKTQAQEQKVCSKKTRDKKSSVQKFPVASFE